MANDEFNFDINRQRFIENTHPQILNFHLNRYAMECLIFGEIGFREKIPFDDYVAKLNLRWLTPMYFKHKIAGIAIDSQERICINENDAADKIFNFETNSLWSMATQDVPVGDEDFELYDFGIGLAKYTDTLRSLFMQILRTDVSPVLQDCPNCDDELRNLSYYSFAVFLYDIKTNKIKPRQCVDKYFSSLPLPDYVKRLVVNVKGKHYLKEINVNSVAYKLAVLSTLTFATPDHAYIFSKKIAKWEQLNGERIDS